MAYPLISNGNVTAMPVRLARGRGGQCENDATRRRRRECVEHALEVRGVSLRFGGVRALTEVSFAVDDGELFSIIGPNGAGKTSIVNCISGRYRPTEGSLIFRAQ